MGLLDVIFFIPGVIFLFSGLPQTYQLIKTKKSQDISSLTYFLTVVAIGIIFFDAIYHGNTSIAVSNGISFCLTSTNLFLILKYKKNVKNSRKR